MRGTRISALLTALRDILNSPEMRRPFKSSIEAVKVGRKFAAELDFVEVNSLTEEESLRFFFLFRDGARRAGIRTQVADSPGRQFSSTASNTSSVDC